MWKQSKDTDIINTGTDESFAINVTEIVKNQDREHPGIKEKWIEGRDRSILGKSFSKYTFELYFALDRATPSSRRIARWGWKSDRTGLATLLNEFSTVSRVVVSHCPCTQLRGHVTFPTFTITSLQYHQTDKGKVYLVGFRGFSIFRDYIELHSRRTSCYSTMYSSERYLKIICFK